MIQKIGKFLSCGIIFAELDLGIGGEIEFVNFPTQKGWLELSKGS